ncbi:MAG TPA: hypothetical protein VMS96_06810 [Terriglobales bacterium]|nr:hypothetical protein [Terriglobales bacterium]
MKHAVILSLVLFSALVFAQQQPKTPEPAKPTQANPNDVKSVDATIRALYDVISGPAGHPRDWSRMRSLFHSGARLVPTGKRPNDPQVGARVLTVEDYIERTTPFFAKEGFYENEVSRKQEQFGSIAHVFSTYESRHAKGEQPFQRGINSIQLFFDGTRWWVMTVMWDAETPQQPIPEKYLR